MPHVTLELSVSLSLKTFSANYKILRIHSFKALKKESKTHTPETHVTWKKKIDFHDFQI